MNQQYQNLLKQLYRVNINHPVRLGLQNINEIYKYLDYPLRYIPTIHVGGTNGKGSVCWKTAKCLENSGYKTGLFVSPHISSFRERIQVNSDSLLETDIIELLPKLIQLCDKHCIPATFFELTTALAFMKFREEKCDVAVIEVGLGGELDATNVIEKPLISVITSVQLDHMNILGDSIEKIALVKAGIMKPNVPILVGPDTPMALLKEQARKKNSTLYEMNQLSNSQNIDILLSSLSINSHSEVTNIRLTNDIVNFLRRENTFFLPNEIVQKSLVSRPSCRFQILQMSKIAGKIQLVSEYDSELLNNCDSKLEIVLDIAHNEAAVTNFIQIVKKKYSSLHWDIHMILGMSADKDIANCINLFLQVVENSSKVHCVAARHPRAITYDKLKEIIDNSARQQNKLTNDMNDRKYTNISQTVHEVVTTLTTSQSYDNRKPLLLICGSAFIMAEARSALGIIEPRDGDILATTLGNSYIDSQEHFIKN